MKIYALGGSGESGRNCFAIETADAAYLIDCGVKRDVSQTSIGAYPLLTEGLVKKLRAVFLSQVHQDHSAALPLLYHLGYTGNIYTSDESIHTVERFIKKWADYVQSRPGSLPYTGKDMTALRLSPLHVGTNDVEGIRITCGRSGYLLGSYWFSLEIGGKQIFYSSDMTWQPYILMRDTPQQADIALYSCTYAGRHIRNDNELAAMKELIEETVDNNGKVLLPVPSKGRSSELYLYLTMHCADIPLYVDKEILDNLKVLSTKPRWVRPFSYIEKGANIHVIRSNAERNAVCASTIGSVIMTRDGMLTAPSGLYYFNQLKTDPSSLVILTGHAAKGTPAQLLFDKPWCQQNHVYLQKSRIDYKIHLDYDDTLALNAQVKPKQAHLFHVENDQTTALAKELTRQGTQVITMETGDTWEIG